MEKDPKAIRIQGPHVLDVTSMLPSAIVQMLRVRHDRGETYPLELVLDRPERFEEIVAACRNHEKGAFEPEGVTAHKVRKTAPAAAASSARVASAPSRPMSSTNRAALMAALGAGGGVVFLSIFAGVKMFEIEISKNVRGMDALFDPDKVRTVATTVQICQAVEVVALLLMGLCGLLFAVGLGMALTSSQASRRSTP